MFRCKVWLRAPCRPCPVSGLVSGIMAEKIQPKPGTGVDMMKFTKLATRVEQVLKEHGGESQQLDPNLILVSPLNRLGSPPNVRHVHHGILRSFQKHGFDKSRPLVGICVRVASEKGKAEVLEHNRKFTQGSPHLPQILEENFVSGPVYASLAGTHLNLALRCLKNGTPSPLGDQSDLLSNLPSLKQVALHGHRWLVLNEDLSKEQQTDISLWRNQDQNENQHTSEIEILRTLQHVATAFLSSGKGKVTQADLLLAAQKVNPVKISPETWLTMCKYFIGFLENDAIDLIEDLSYFHSACVDLRELTVPLKHFDRIATEVSFKSCPQVRHHLVATQYCLDKVASSCSGPGTSQFLEAAQVLSFAKKPDQVNTMEKTIRSLKTKYLPVLIAQGLSERTARLEIGIYVDLVIRCQFAKHWPKNMEPKVTMSCGGLNEAKIEALGVHWANVVAVKHPSLDFPKASGLVPSESQEPEDSSDKVDLGGLRRLKRTESAASSGPDLDRPKFKRGDQVTVVRRMTWTLPEKGKDKYRKDLPVGLEGVIIGWADAEMRNVLLEVALTLNGKKEKFQQACAPRNLQLTSDWKMSQPGGHGEDAEPEAAAPPGMEWLIGDSKPGDLKVEHKWQALVGDSDQLVRGMYLRGRVSNALQALMQALPTYTDDDFVIANRKTEKGVWKSELYTKRTFEPLEIMFGPCSSQLKETHLMLSANAPVGLPKGGGLGAALQGCKVWPWMGAQGL